MIPFCQIFADGNDVTEKVMPYVMGVEVKDEADDKSDSVTIKLDDRRRLQDNAVLEIPLIGTTLTVVMGYLDGLSRQLGTYLIDDISVDSPAATLTITGRAAAMNKSYRTPRSQSYHQKSLGSIIEDIAKRNGYEAKTDPDLAKIVVRHIDQNGESDMAFATRLASTYDAVAKPVEGKMVLAKRGTGKAITGEDLPIITISESHCSKWSFKYSARDEAGESNGLKDNGENDQVAAGSVHNQQKIDSTDEGEGVIHIGSDVQTDPPLGSYPEEEPTVEAPTEPGAKGGVRAYYYDIRSGEKKEVTVGKEPYHELRYTWHNEAEAKAAISSYKNKSSRGKASFSADMGGNPNVMAEGRLIQSPAFRPYIPTEWRIKSVTQRYEPSGGYTTSVDCELFDASQENTTKNVKETNPSADDTIDNDAPPRATEDGDEGEGVIHIGQ